MRGRVVAQPGRYEIPNGWIPPIYAELDIISVFWHPIDGPQVAGASEYGDIIYFPIGEVEIISQ